MVVDETEVYSDDEEAHEDDSLAIGAPRLEVQSDDSSAETSAFTPHLTESDSSHTSLEGFSMPQTPSVGQIDQLLDENEDRDDKTPASSVETVHADSPHDSMIGSRVIETDGTADAEDDVPLSRKVTPVSLKRSANARNPFNFAPDEVSRSFPLSLEHFGLTLKRQLSKKLVKVQKGRKTDVSASSPVLPAANEPTIGHSMLPQTDEMVQLRAKRSNSNLTVSKSLPPFVFNSVLAMSDDEKPLGDLVAKASLKSSPASPILPSSPPLRLDTSAPSSPSTLASPRLVTSPRSPMMARPPARLTAPPSMKSAPSNLKMILGPKSIYIGDLAHAHTCQVTEATTAGDIVKECMDMAKLPPSGGWALLEVWRDLGLGAFTPTLFAFDPS